MSYTNVSSLLDEFSISELSKLSGNNDGVTINEDRINMFCDMAATEIDANLSILYNLPFGYTPKVIATISHELSVYYIYSSYYKNDEIPEQIKWRKIYANSLLKLIKRGEILILPEITKNRIVCRNIEELN